MRLGIIGGGTVGQAIARSYLEWEEVRVADPIPERATHSLDDTLDSDLVFVCLPTPPTTNGGIAQTIDLSTIEDLCLKVAGSSAALVLKSTVSVGTTKRLRKTYGLDNLIHSPEFLTSRCAVTDAQMPARNIIGGEPCDARIKLAQLYLHRFPGVPLFQVSSDESEMIKLMSNAFFAVKIAFFNEMYMLAEKLDLSWSRVMAGVLSDGRIAHAHTRVPGPNGAFGFGGACLAKDLDCLIYCIRQAGLLPAVTEGAAERNLSDRHKKMDDLSRKLA